MNPTYFHDQWLQMHEFKAWLMRGDTNTSAKCRVCPNSRNKIELSKYGSKSIEKSFNRKEAL